MSYDRPTSKDVDHIFSQYAELVNEYGLARPGYNVVLHHGFKIYELFEMADQSLWGQKEDDWQTYGSGYRHPLVGNTYLGNTARQAWDTIADRKAMVYGIVQALKLEKTNPILDCGHFPTPVASGSGGMGKAYGPDRETMCYACADDATRAEILNPATDRITLYVAGDPYPHEPWRRGNLRGRIITTWNGTEMGKVVESSNRSVHSTPTGGWYELYWITVRMDDGSKWYGRTSGPGMHVNLKRKKVSK